MLPQLIPDAHRRHILAFRRIVVGVHLTWYSACCIYPVISPQPMYSSLATDQLISLVYPLITFSPLCFGSVLKDTCFRSSLHVYVIFRFSYKPNSPSTHLVPLSLFPSQFRSSHVYVVARLLKIALTVGRAFPYPRRAPEIPDRSALNHARKST